MQLSHQILCYADNREDYKFVPTITLMCKLKVSSQTFTNNFTMDEEFPTACSLFALVLYVVVDIMVASLVQNFLIKTVILIQFCNPDTLCIILWQSLHSKFFLWSFLVMGLFRYDI